MRRSISSVRISENQVRYRTKLEGDDCPPDTYESRMQQSRLIEAIHDQPGLVACGVHPFQRLTIRHDGTRWIAEAEALAEEQSNGELGRSGNSP